MIVFDRKRRFARASYMDMVTGQWRLDELYVKGETRTFIFVMRRQFPPNENRGVSAAISLYDDLDFVASRVYCSLLLLNLGFASRFQGTQLF
ncbi:hypothetical protein LWI29_000333 [Acer saccharum]|uniref:Uncharacterized protein n=1 Tax=Acer saccharum TaxID=4024 RepID=A0AA39W0G4_ACESA|nr:hypothetical protein LWI29_000333 [Acer saccharum]